MICFLLHDIYLVTFFLTLIQVDRDLLLLLLVIYSVNQTWRLEINKLLSPHYDLVELIGIERAQAKQGVNLLLSFCYLQVLALK